MSLYDERAATRRPTPDDLGGLPAALLQRKLQRRAAQRAAEGEGDAAAAERGIATPAGALPHLDRLQPLFGRHDLSGVKAHAGPEAGRRRGFPTWTRTRRTGRRYEAW